MLWLLDRRGGRHELDHRPDEPAAQALLRHGIPPTSVLVYRDDEEVVPDDAPLASATVHIARLIEGYDLMGIRLLYGPEVSGSGADSPVISGLLQRRLSMASTGALRIERHHLGADAVARYVEQTVVETMDRFSLLPSGSSVVLGLSGGVDSASLLMLLSAYRDQLVGDPPTIHAATFQDFDSRYSETFEFAARLALILIKDSFDEPPPPESYCMHPAQTVWPTACTERSGTTATCSCARIPTANPDFTVGNIFDQDLRDIWTSDRRKRVLAERNAKRCFQATCPHNSRGHHHNRIFHQIEQFRREGRMAEVRRWVRDLRDVTHPLGHSFFV